VLYAGKYVLAMAAAYLAFVHLQLARGNFEQGVAAGAASGKAHGASLNPAGLGQGYQLHV
jgi:hypothetical protein